MSYQPKVSIVTISYNIVSNIEKTIQSVINQTYPHIEYIVIDGGSKDGTVDIIKKYADKITYWVSEPDKGIYDAMNKGIDAATGDWINFMNAGDVFYDNDVISRLFSQIENDCYDIIHGDLVIDSPVGLFLKKTDNLKEMDQRMVVGHQATFMKTSYHKKNKYDTTYRASGDYAFFYQAYKNKAIFKYVPLRVALFDGKAGMSNDNFYTVNYEDLRIYGKDHLLSARIALHVKYFIWKIKRALKSNLKGKYMTHLLRNRMEQSGYIKL